MRPQGAHGDGAPLPLTAMGAIERLGLPEERWVDVGPDRVHYREWDGPPDGPPFVLVHGLGGSLVNWAPVAPGLARRGRVVALDQAGFGLTPPSSLGTSVSAHRRMLGRFLEALALPPAILVGNSFGGMVSLLHCAHAPETVDRMVLVDAPFPRTPSVAPQFPPRIAALFGLYMSRRLGRWVSSSRTRRLGPERLLRETLRAIAGEHDSIDPDLVDALVELAVRRAAFDYSAQAFSEVARSIFIAQAVPGRYRERVRSARRPALVMHGGKDPIVPRALATAAAADHPYWKLVVFPDLGHIPQMEAPERWLAAVEAWLAETAAEPAPAPAS